MIGDGHRVAVRVDGAWNRWGKVFCIPLLAKAVDAGGKRWAQKNIAAISIIQSNDVGINPFNLIFPTIHQSHYARVSVRIVGDDIALFEAVSGDGDRVAVMVNGTRGGWDERLCLLIDKSMGPRER